MPTPGKNESQSDFVSRCIPIVMDEGTAEDNKQAAAVCYSMWRESKKERGEGIGAGGERQGDGGADMCVCPECGATVEHKKGTPCAGVECTKCGAAMEGEQEKAMSLWQTVKGFFNPVKQEPELEKEQVMHPFTVWKDKETGQYRWLAVYSNKWRDEDNPPEILASAAHKEFEEAVDKGDWPYPEAWLWHIPGTRFGVADLVTYDDSGFALASGTVDKGKEDIAEALSQEEDLATSHGMPVKEIERDEEDSTIITRYRSVEISPLPREAAANKYGTGFEILREVKMAIPEHKRPSVEKWLGADRMKALEDFLEDKSKELDALNIQSKDTTETVEEEVQEAAQETVEEEGGRIGDGAPESKEEDAPAEETPAYVTADEVAEAVGATLKPIMDRLEALAGLPQVVEEQAKSLKELQKGSEEKAAEIIANTPAASLYDRINSVIGSPETFVDGRTSLAKAGPKETEEGREGATPIPLLNELMDRSWNQMAQ